jgi:hypothetical protein
MTRARDLAKGTFSGDLTVDTNTLVVDSANNRVGVGTASPDLSLDVTRSGDGDIAVFQTTANHGVVLSAPSSTTLQIASVQGSKNLDLWANTLSFSAGGTERLRILSTGGITFNGDTAAANALDDYEEGVHTCTVTMASGTCSLYANYDKIKYTKVGRLVTIQGQIRVQSVSSPSGAMLVSMPFSIDTTDDEGANISGSLVRTYLGNAPTGGLFLHGTMVFNTGAGCSLQWSRSGSVTADHVPVANEYLVFNFSYAVA